MDKEIKSVALIGAGAVGSYIIWGLSDLLKDNFCVVAKDERKNRLEKGGIWINHQNYPVKIRTPEEARGADLVIIATKYGALHEILDDIDTIVSDHTIVMSLLNGVDSEEIIAERIGEEHLIYSLIKIASHHENDGIIFDPDSTMGIYFGEKDTADPSPRMRLIADLFDKTALNYHMSSSILQDIWYKFAFNVGWNLPQAIVSCGVGAYAASEHMMALRNSLREEVRMIAAAKGIDITELSDIEKMTCPSAPASRYSTLQDLDAKRHTEIEMFSGTICRYGKELHLSTPYNEFTYHLIRALEEKNDGKFEF